MQASSYWRKRECCWKHKKRKRSSRNYANTLHYIQLCRCTYVSVHGRVGRQQQNVQGHAAHVCNSTSSLSCTHCFVEQPTNLCSRAICKYTFVPNMLYLFKYFFEFACCALSTCYPASMHITTARLCMGQCAWRACAVAYTQERSK
jgi:hypothetical protein